jgi:hypothetical protein
MEFSLVLDDVRKEDEMKRTCSTNVRTENLNLRKILEYK